MAKAADLIGKRFNRLVVIERVGSRNGKAMWKCKCDCGGYTVTDSNHLTSGRTQSCGCIARESIANVNKGKTLRVDLAGKRFGRLEVIEFSHFSKDKKRTYWKCRCDCGNEIITRADGLKNGHTNSCGCYNKEVLQNATWNVVHGLTNSRLYRIWTGMKTRCYDENCKNYNDYGGRGIAICSEWLNDFQTFYDWAMANGYADNLSIDRIDVNGNYEPSNCRWATDKEQVNNTRRNVKITYKGKTDNLTNWCRELGLERKTVSNRIKSGWSAEEAFETPIGQKRK